jgi:hypothetical protein
VRTLYLHVGQDKTGSSYIQSSLANSVEYLKSQNIFYPVNDNILQAKNGKISSGNMGLLSTVKLGAYRHILPNNSILISGEQLFRKLPEIDYSLEFSAFLEKFSITEVKLLLFIREPVEHVASAYQQAIKRGGYSGPIEEFTAKYLHTKKVFEFIKFCESNEDYKLEIRNYSQRKSTILEVLENWLEIPVASLARPKQLVVNRSMTRSELEFQRVINIYLGKKASFISDALCEKIPNIGADKVNIPLESQKLLINKLKIYCDYINKYAKNTERSDQYEYTLEEDIESTETYKFNQQQIEVIASAIAQHYNSDTE